MIPEENFAKRICSSYFVESGASTVHQTGKQTIAPEIDSEQCGCLTKSCLTKSCLTKSDPQRPRVIRRGRDWVEWLPNISSYMLTEWPPSPPPVAEMAALLLIHRLQIMQ